jgi:hypothetical protein
VTLDGVRYPRPGEVEYEGVVLRQEEPRRKGLTELARARRVRLRRGDRELTLEAEGLCLRAESPRLAMEQVGALLQRSGERTYDRVSLSTPTCELELGQELPPFRLRDVAGTFQADRAAPTVRASYRLSSAGSTTRCELTLTRDRKAEPVRTSLVLQTMEGLPLPAGVLDIFVDSAAWLGAEAKVQAKLTLRQAEGNDWEADFSGELLDMDLAALVGRRFPSHRLNGLARVAVDSARWANRPGQGFGWVEARGELTAGQGSIGLGLLRALASEMSFRLPRAIAEGLDGHQADVEFTSLGFSFALTRDGEIRVGGALGNDFAPDVVMAGASNPLAYAPEGVASVRGLIKTLFPVGAADPGVLVPLTAESRVLLSLPMPPELASKAVGAN